MIKVLIFWDVYWRIWRKGLQKELDSLVKKYEPDFKIVNIDNISYGKWPIESHIIEFEKLGFDVLTTWNHYFDNIHKIKDYINSWKSKVIRCANFLWDVPGEWYKIVEKNWKKLLVIHLLWQVFMWMWAENPFRKVDEILEKFSDEKLDWIIVDFHKETTSESYGMWFYLDWRVSFVFGTHTHVQTNDELILPNWTWLISDVWMNWPLFSVIWAEFETVKSVFLNWYRDRRQEQCLDSNYLVNWVYVEIWDDGKCQKIEKINIKGKLV